MKVLLYLVSLLSLVYGDDQVCILDHAGFNICIKRGHITSIENFKHQKDLTLKINSNVTFDDEAFAETEIRKLELVFGQVIFPSQSSYGMTLQPATFRGSPYITDLLVKNVMINFNNAQPLKYLKQLNSFSWQLSTITEVPAEQLATVPSLRKLSFYFNAITVLHANDFAALANLTHLEIQPSQIRTLEPGCFNGLHNLEVLDLSHNKLETLPDVFGGLDKLKKLSLNYGRIAHFEPNVLQRMPSLYELEMANNRLVEIPTGTFDNLPHLRILNLNGNHGLVVKRGLFNSLHNLTELYLEELSGPKMEQGAFSGLNLTVLGLQRCDALQAGCFQGLVVEILKLNGWHYQEIVPRSFEGLTAKTVDLSSNNIEKIGAEDFTGLTTEVLNLDFNKIHDIAQDAFKNTKVSKVILERNPIQNVNKAIIGLPETVIVTEKYMAGRWYEN
uniref:LRRCT domain-containing protein n=1 Tax=Bracon brevicornis TaxID=1563983 RepID=A0A6V7IR71_9HYME